MARKDSGTGSLTSMCAGHCVRAGGPQAGGVVWSIVPPITGNSFARYEGNLLQPLRIFGEHQAYAHARRLWDVEEEEGAFTCWRLVCDAVAHSDAVGVLGRGTGKRLDQAWANQLLW